jgi:hypothetical protein
MEGEELAVLEGLEAVDGDLLEGGDLGQLAGLEEQTVAPEAGDLVGDGGGAAQKRAGDLAVGHAADDQEKDAGGEIGALLPVGRREGLGAEVSTAVTARKALDTLGASRAQEEALAFEAPPA